MKALGIVGSMRKTGHTNTLVKHCLGELQTLVPGVETETIHVTDMRVLPCQVTCSKYCSDHPYQCARKDDDLTDILAKMIAADALVIGAPLYVRVPPASFHMFVERLISIFFFNECNSSHKTLSPLNDKPCGLIAVAEYSNPHSILEYLRDFCLLLRMNPVTLKNFPYLGVAGQGDISHDEIFKPFERSAMLAQVLAARLQCDKQPRAVLGGT